MTVHINRLNNRNSSTVPWDDGQKGDFSHERTISQAIRIPRIVWYSTNDPRLSVRNEAASIVITALLARSHNARARAVARGAPAPHARLPLGSSILALATHYSEFITTSAGPQ
ncbi:hypothetical protein EVAR_263_1 [Eumeta japonica]|uniref:Uncharacterized protein n=1 Tax=Eumeta variegata TaxID=151549 RepID=A0A4C1SC75_EUMVA|nr:hypothetical protein EVAR_263_1 [Eumeta japonica]